MHRCQAHSKEDLFTAVQSGDEHLQVIVGSKQDVNTTYQPPFLRIQCQTAQPLAQQGPGAQLKHSQTLSLVEATCSSDEIQSNIVTDGSYMLTWWNTVQHCHWWKLHAHLMKHSPTLSLMVATCSHDESQSNVVNVTDGSYMLIWWYTVQHCHWW